ncbi:universal stress protein [Kribbella soli]|uniref:Universal stress protein n=1 Tax=Kribbella soli TaxID=1124743 RepID=A0A4R0HHL6_9ACTN|nr:universal stress protein [Kribbella soli]TCC08452.1 universal stress protein [Kribbella soli]
MSAELPVLVGIDGSRDGLIALTWATAYAELHQAPLHAVYVLDDEGEVGGGPPPTEADDGSEVLDDALQELGRLGFRDASLEVRHGHPAQALLELSERSIALVVGRRGMGGFAELVLGSTSQTCTALATKVPLIVVPDTWNPATAAHQRIVVGVGGLGRTAFSELRMGSVARGLLHHSYCPVAVVHHPEP